MYYTALPKITLFCRLRISGDHIIAVFRAIDVTRTGIKLPVAGPLFNVVDQQWNNVYYDIAVM